MSTSGGHNFDFGAHAYEKTLDGGLSVSGENSAFFAKGRITWLGTRLRQLGFIPRTAIDYGCGIGGSTAFLMEILGVQSVVGLDSSATSLEVARARHRHLAVEYRLTEDYTPNGRVDLAFCNGVFHHIPPAERPGALAYMAECLRPDGLLAFWENNPWNPGTRYIMRKLPFDRDAIPLTSIEARALARTTQLQILTTDFCFVFPRVLGMLRRFEPCLASIPIGAQYLVLCRKTRSTVSR